MKSTAVFFLRVLFFVFVFLLILFLRSRKKNREQAEALLKAGNVSGARDCFQKAVDITPEIAHQLIKVQLHMDGHMLASHRDKAANFAYLPSMEAVEFCSFPENVHQFR